jgi:hypothetical protein
MHWTRCKNNSWLDLHGIGDQCNQHSALSSTAKSYACNQNTLTNRRPSICPNSRNQSQSNCWEGPLEHYNKLFNLWRTFCDVLRKHHEEHWATTYFCFSSRMCTYGYWSPEHCDDLLNSSRFYDVFQFFVTDVNWWILKPRTLRRFVKFVPIRPTTLWHFSRFVAINK